jgi:hypothetical protein
MSTRLFGAVALASVVVALSATGPGFDAAEAAQSQPPQGTAQPQQPGMQNMMKMHEQMMADMKAWDAKLDALVKDMNAANGEAKVTAIAAVVNELVQQHKTMHGHMGQMHQQMMMGGRGRMMRQ